MDNDKSEYGTNVSGAPTWATRELDGSYVDKARRRGHIDLPFLVLTLVILTIGVVMVLSASFASAFYNYGDPTKYFARQLIFAISGVALMIVTSRMSVAMFWKIAMPMLFVSIILLALVPIIGVSENGAKRWLGYKSYTFQPSEVAKLAVVLSFSAMICNFRSKMRTFKYGVLPFGIIVAVIVGLLVFEPHLSASVIIIAVAAIMMFAGGTRLHWFALVGVVVVIVAYLAVTKFSYASSRITAWLDPEADPLDSGYQILQSLYAVGSGGLTGLGLGQSRQKFLYLPEEHNDYIFAIWCEELGFIGAVLLIALFALLIIRGFWLAIHARDRFGSLIITGITSLLAIQVFLNIAVVTNFLPSTGISLPFFSYGGTALWIQLVEMGIILAISRDIPITRNG
jgi:cell division protein FtsW